MTAPAEVAPVSPRQREREAFRRSRARRSTLISFTSTMLFAGVAWLVVTGSPGWPRVQATFFSVEAAREAWPRVVSGLWVNIRVLAVAAVCILVIGLALAALRTLQGAVWFPLRALATVYVDLFRGIPLIILLYLVGFGIPGLRFPGLPTSAVVLGTVALVLTYSAYVAEVFRAGIESVHPSQRAAARSLGLDHSQTMRLVVLPQATRRVLPPLLNDFVALQKDVGLISVLGAVDAVRAAQIESAQAYNFTPYVLAGLLFVLMAVPSVRLADYVAGRMAKRRDVSMAA